MKKRPDYRWHLSSRELLSATCKGYTPPERWTAAAFAEVGAAMIRGMTRTAKVVQRKAWAPVIRASRSVMRRQVEAVGEEALRLVAIHGERSVKAPSLIVWEAALNEVFNQAAPELIAELVPPLQSVADQGRSKSDEILGNTSRPASPELILPTQQIARRVARIDETTRRRIRESIAQSLEDGLTVAETVQRLIDEAETTLPEWRLRTIARTEVSNAWTLGSIASMRETPGLISVDVIGCESREIERWNDPSYQQFMYQGESTCNIEGVSIREAHLLNFHPNHTGVMVPSEFRDE